MFPRDNCYRINKHIDDFVMGFIYKYFFKDGDFHGELHYVEHDSDSLHFNLFVNDYYFSLDDIYTSLWYNIPWEIIDEWYTLSTDLQNPIKINLKNFYLLKIKEGND